MAIAMLHTPQSMTRAQYDDAIKRLDAAGASAPPGRLYHVCFGTEPTLRVFDIWESREAFDAFGQTLVPILQEVGLNYQDQVIEISEVQNIIQG